MKRKVLVSSTGRQTLNSDDDGFWEKFISLESLPQTGLNWLPEPGDMLNDYINKIGEIAFRAGALRAFENVRIQFENGEIALTAHLEGPEIEFERALCTNDIGFLDWDFNETDKLTVTAEDTDGNTDSVRWGGQE